MASTISGILSTYGFATRHDGSQWWGQGSLVWGDVVEVENLGNDLYKVKHHGWFYDQYGDCMRDKKTEQVFHGARLLEFLFDKFYLMPRRA